jgi:uncharacterized protein involved in outer membrane biogenesis
MEVPVKGKKILKISLGIVGALLLVFLLTFLFWLGPAVKVIAEHFGLKALGTPLTINNLSINPKNGTIHLSDFAIANPDTFGKSNAVSLASLDVSIDIGSIFSSTVVVHQVAINSPRFVYEQSSASDNINEFIASIQEFIGYDPKAPPPPADPEELEKKRRKAEKKALKKKGQEPKIVLVESLQINDVQFLLANTHDPLLDFSAGFEQLSVSMTNGTVQLDNLYVSNPGRLETPNLFSLEQVEILLQPGTIYSSNIAINAVNIRKPHAFVEYNPETDTLGEFLKIASSLAAKIPTNAPGASATNAIAAAQAPAEPAPAPPEVILGPLTIDDVQFHVVNIGDPKLNVHLGLGQLVVALQTGDITLDHLFFTNPKRLATPNLFDLEGIHLKFAPDSLGADTLVIEDVQVLRPHAFLELNKDSNTTAEFMKIVSGFTARIPGYPVPGLPQPSSPPPAKPEPMQNAETPPAPLELHNLLVDDIQVKLLDTTPTNNIAGEPHMIAGIGSISVKLVDGLLQIKGISVPNVAGFHAANIFHLANIDVAIQPDSLFSDQVVIDKIFINAPEVNLEQTEKSGNVAVLQTQLMQFVPPTDVNPEAAEKQVAQPTEPESEPVPLAEQPVILHQLMVTNLAVTLKLPVPTNTPTTGPMGMVNVGKLNPIGKVSLSNLNPLSGHGSTEEGQIVEPDAPIKLVGFDFLSIEPLKGLLYIDGLRVANPPGFSRWDLVNIQQFRLDLEPDTLQTDTVLIEDILVKKPRVRYERQIMSDNIKALQQEIEQATSRRKEYMGEEGQPQATAAAAAAEESNQEDGDGGKKVIIEHFLISSGMVQAKLSALPSIPVPLPDIELKNIGKKQGGATVAEASAQVFNTFYETLVGAVGNATGFAGDTLKGVGSLGMGALGNITGGMTHGIENAIKDTEDAVKNLNEKRKKRRGAGGRRHPLK